ncbi:seleno protein SelK1 [Haematococcus lacustris]
MVYITRAGTVQQKRTGLLAVIAAFFAGLVDLVSVFFSTLLSPTAHSNLQKRVTSYPGSGSRQSGGRSGGGPRITGIDKINGPSGSAACPSGG